MIFIPYEDRFGHALPLSSFPLPIPGNVKIPPKEVKTRWWSQLLDFAEKYVQLPKDKLTYDIPAKLIRYEAKNLLIASLRADIVVGMQFYARWSLISEEEAVYFPKGVEVLVEKKRKDVLHAIQLARAEDWHQHVVDEYFDAFTRCCSLCDATRRGHLADVGEKLSFSHVHVKQTMNQTSGFSGLVSYNHIYKMLLSAAQES